MLSIHRTLPIDAEEVLDLLTISKRRDDFEI